MRRRNRAIVVTVVALLTGGLLGVVAPATPAQAADWFPVPSNRTYTIDGHGFGHGKGMSQRGAQGAAIAGLDVNQILAFYYPGTTQTPIGAPSVRVQLTATVTGDQRIDSAAGTTVMAIQDTATGDTVYAEPGKFRVLTQNGRERVLRYDGSAWVDFPIAGRPDFAGPLAFWSEDGVVVYTSSGSPVRYRGSVAVVRTGTNQSTAVNTVNMQEYLMGVVPSESPPSWAPAALQAQAVAARSYAWWDVQTPSTQSYDICDTTACQVYKGRSVEDSRTNSAIAATAGIALYYNGAPAFTQFSASNGGASLDGGQPYLRAALDPYDGLAGNPDNSWTTTLTASYLEANYAIGTLQGLRVMSRAGLGEWGGYITSLQIVGSSATVTVKSPRFGLKSTWWKPRDEGNPFGGFDAVTPVTGNQVRVEGWALDPDTNDPIIVHAYLDGGFQNSYMADVPRPDVAAVLPGRGDRHGFDLLVPVSQGRHQICMFAINTGPGGMNTPLGCLTADTSGLPVGNIETAGISAGEGLLTGWAVDPDTSGSLDVHAYVNGVGSGAFAANGSRPDVGSAFPGAGNAHGFSVRVPLQPGINQICLFAINLPTPGINPQLGCRTLVLKVVPVGNFEAAAGRAADLTVTGWALDPETNAPIDVHVYVDGVNTATGRADGSRPDVAALYPDAGAPHGFSFPVAAAPGTHEVCVYAINVLQGSVNPQLGCRTVDVGVLPTGRIEAVTATAFEARVVGWALDGDTTNPIDVHLYVDGRFLTAVTALVSRPDVGAAFPASGAAHGFDTTLSLSAGRHSVCAFAINVLGGKGNPLLSCADVTVASGQTLPFGNLDSVTVANGITVATGWVVEPDAPTAPISTHFYVDGQFAGIVAASESRPDVGAAFPGVGPAHGYTGYFVLPAGRHTVCSYAINQGAGSVNPGLGCVAVTVP
ncbi:SpoIID/LytB domain-containing protein [Blastococcus sp. CT_GayMR16]|uniref:SpoIID/LytB domain-containing protein n=1 Tax=Blastococcus sp. CT_GayMR16 TaxID=2559607 RepID=UPI001072EEAF|nr:SpoIID/LytB domain-containing protein [Blastococcus sp. CT_GayMR16]TFV87776.1 SpoIID/LytB domain-containing protein [Blastococcus sp. CT_GayMR16]